MKKRMKVRQLKASSIIIGSFVALAILIAFGIVTVLIPNSFFTRMSPVYFYDYIFLVLTAALSGSYVGLWYYIKRTSEKCNYAAGIGIVGGFLSFGCAICNKLLVLALGLSAVTAYFMPLQPILGVISTTMLWYAVYAQYKFLDTG